MGPTAAARLSARTTERASSTQDAMAIRAAVLCHRGGHSYYSRTYYHNGVYSTGVYRGYYYGGVTTTATIRGLSTALVSTAGPITVGLANCLGCGRLGLGRSAVVWLLRWLVQSISVYASPAFWLTDYLIAANLQAAYAAQAEVALAEKEPAIKAWIDQQFRGPMAVEAARLRWQ